MNTTVQYLLTVAIALLFLQGCANGAFVLEHDVLAGDIAEQSDRNFTQSTAVSYSTKGNPDTPIGLLHKKFYDYLPFFNSSCQPDSLTLDDHVGVTAFTPDRLTEEDPAELAGDRPYASLLFYGNTEIRSCGKYAERPDDAVDKRGLFIGLLGLNITRDFQSYVHDLNDGQEPRGWHTQISDGGEPTFLYTWQRTYATASDDKAAGLKTWDTSWSQGINLGYYTNAFFGFDARVGVLNSLYWQHGGSRLAAGTEAPAPVFASRSKDQKTYDRKCLWLIRTEGDCFLFFGTRLRLVGYNAMLQGQFRDSLYELDSREVHGMVAQASLGASFDTRWRVFGIADSTRITIAFHARSPEYDSEIDQRAHYWGGFYFSTTKKAE